MSIRIKVLGGPKSGKTTHLNNTIEQISGQYEIINFNIIINKISRTKIDKKIKIVYLIKNKQLILNYFDNIQHVFIDNVNTLNDTEYKFIDILEKCNTNLYLYGEQCPYLNNKLFESIILDNNLSNHSINLSTNFTVVDIVNKLNPEQLIFILQNIETTIEKQEYKIIDGITNSYTHPNINMYSNICINNDYIILNIYEKTNCGHTIMLLLQSFIVGNINKYILINHKNKRLYNINIIFNEKYYFDILNMISTTINCSITNLILVYDLETTGLIKKDNYPEITQISMLDYHTNYPFYNDYVRINGHISSFITKLTGINNQMLKNSKTLDNTKDILKNKLVNVNNMTLIAHNGNKFDHILLKHYDVLPNMKINYLDSIDIAKQVDIKFDNYKMNTIYKTLFGTDIINAHNALYDVIALVKILKTLNY